MTAIIRQRYRLAKAADEGISSPRLRGEDAGRQMRGGAERSRLGTFGITPAAGDGQSKAKRRLERRRP
jgi:hypothetical protein